MLVHMDRARFVSCECGKHGRIVLADGHNGPEVCLKRYAELYVVTGLQHERFTKANADDLMREVAESSLPSELTDESIRMSWLAEAWNYTRGEEAILTEMKVEPAILHQVLQSRADVPQAFIKRLQDMLSRRG